MLTCVWQIFFQVSEVICWSYVATGHFKFQRIDEWFVCLLVPSSTHTFNPVENKCHLYMGSRESISWHEILANLAILAWRKQKYIPLYDKDEEAVSAIVNEDVDIDTDDIIWKLKNWMINSQNVTVIQVVWVLIVGKLWAIRIPRNKPVLRIRGQNLTVCQMQSP